MQTWQTTWKYDGITENWGWNLGPAHPSIFSSSCTNKNKSMLLTPYSSVFTSLYGSPSVCVYCSIAWDYKYSVLQSSELWMGYWHRSAPAGTVFYFLLRRNRTEPNREAENTGQREREGERGLRMRRNQEVVTQIEPKRRRTNCQIDSRRHTQAQRRG